MPKISPTSSAFETCVLYPAYCKYSTPSTTLVMVLAISVNIQYIVIASA